MSKNKQARNAGPDAQLAAERLVSKQLRSKTKMHGVYARRDRVDGLLARGYTVLADDKLSDLVLVAPKQEVQPKEEEMAGGLNKKKKSKKKQYKPNSKKV